MPTIAFWQHHPIADQQALSLAQATLRFHERVGGDLVKLSPPGTFQASAMGLVDAWQGDSIGRRSIVSRPITGARDWTQLCDEGLGEGEEVALAAAAWLCQRLGKETPVLATVFSPLTQALQLAGADLLATHWDEAPDALQQGLECITRRTRRLIGQFRDAGVGGVYYVAQQHVAHALPPGMDSRCGRLLDDQLLREAQGLEVNIAHLHGAPLVRELPVLPEGWACHFEWDAMNPDPAEISRRCGSPVAIGLPLTTLLEVKCAEDCRTVVRAHQALCPRWCGLVGAACMLPLDFPLQQAGCWVDAMRGWQV